VDESQVTPERFRALVEESPDALFLVHEGRLVYANRRGLDLLRASNVADLAERPAWAFVSEHQRSRVRDRHAGLLAGRADRVRDSDLLIRCDGSVIDVESISVPFPDFGGVPAVLIAAREITDPSDHRLAVELLTAEQRFTEAFRLAPTGMLLLDAEGRVLDANGAAADLVGIPSSALIGQPSLRLLHADDRSLVRSWLRTLSIGKGNSVSGERRIVRTDGAITWVQSSMARLPGSPPTFVVHLVDVTERRETEARLAHQAMHDSLTGLPNRALLFDRLALAVRAAQRGGPGVTVLYLDLDNFKLINDTRGHAAGDRVLSEVADRLLAVLRPADTVARLGGDEFAVVAGGLPVEAARELAERIEDAISTPVDDIPIEASVGMAHSSAVPLDVDALLRAADAEMYRAKQRNRERRDS
jgi:diguanylate cyclase (GGDEF)-like protein/PAS domain S-box-containing protein